MNITKKCDESLITLTTRCSSHFQRQCACVVFPSRKKVVRTFSVQWPAALGRIETKTKINESRLFSERACKETDLHHIWVLSDYGIPGTRGAQGLNILAFWPAPTHPHFESPVHHRSGAKLCCREFGVTLRVSSTSTSPTSSHSTRSNLYCMRPRKNHTSKRKKKRLFKLLSDLKRYAPEPFSRKFVPLYRSTNPKWLSLTAACITEKWGEKYAWPYGWSLNRPREVAGLVYPALKISRYFTRSLKIYRDLFISWEISLFFERSR